MVVVVIGDSKQKERKKIIQKKQRNVEKEEGKQTEEIR